MRRVVTYVLLGLGVFAVALGLLLRFYAYPALAKVPHNIKTTSVAQGSGITALVYVPDGNGSSTPEIRDNLSLTSTTYVTGDLTQPEVKEDGDVTSWVEASIVKDDADDLTVTAGVRRLCLDRHTAQAVKPCEGQYMEDEKGKPVKGTRTEIQQPGQNFKFPFGTEQKTYQWFDSTTVRAFDASFAGEDTVQGLEVYKFVQRIPPTKIADRDVPGPLVGQTEPTVQAELYYENVRTLWVEPVTGAVISGKEEQKQELRTAGQDAGQGTYVLNGTLQLNDATVKNNVAEADKNKSKLFLLTTMPTILWIVGGVLVLAALALMLLARSRPAGKRSVDTPPGKRASATARS